ncbi:MAG TPA: nickel pincer cofactor biosynthesis protein LarC [Gemmatimonadaceae bacterium]|nr:nickel pincer cofactor biosynthesis protein LarC [Gemmatimonadaceae bacterium]
MSIGILDPFSGISGDMTLGALLGAGLDPEWLRALPSRLALDGVTVRIDRVQRAGIACWKVDFDIPPQPHGRHLKQIREIVSRAGLPPRVLERSLAAFDAIATVEGEVHGVPPENVHLHEAGAVDAILDVVGAMWGVELLGLETIHCGPISVGDGTVQAAHGTLPVPAPATLKLLEGHVIRPGPDGAGELVTPTGAAIVRVLSSGPAPASYVPLRSGFGAGTKDPHGRPNALRLVVAEPAAREALLVEQLVTLATDLDDMDGESLAAAADALRAAGALDVVLVPTLMKKGRPGVRVELLATAARADALENALFAQTTAIGVRRTAVERHALPREERTVQVMGQDVRVKVVAAPDGTRRAKPEFDDVARVAAALGRPVREVHALAREAARAAAGSGGDPIPAGAERRPRHTSGDQS